MRITRASYISCLHRYPYPLPFYSIRRGVPRGRNQIEFDLIAKKEKYQTYHTTIREARQHSHIPSVSDRLRRSALSLVHNLLQLPLLIGVFFSAQRLVQNLLHLLFRDLPPPTPLCLGLARPTAASNGLGADISVGCVSVQLEGWILVGRRSCILQ